MIFICIGRFLDFFFLSQLFEVAFSSHFTDAGAKSPHLPQTHPIWYYHLWQQWVHLVSSNANRRHVLYFYNLLQLQMYTLIDVTLP